MAKTLDKTKRSMVIEVFRDVMSNPNEIGIGARQLTDECLKRGNSISIDTVNKALNYMYDHSIAEYKITSKGKCWRLVGTENKFPPEYNEIIFNAVKEINDETGKAATVTEVMKKVGSEIGLDRQSVNEHLKQMCYSDNYNAPLRTLENYDKFVPHTYIVNSNEYKNIKHGVRTKRKNPKTHTDFVKETITEVTGAFWKRDVANAKSNTHVGDHFNVIVIHSWSDKNKRIETVDKEVTAVLPNLCMFNDGTTLPWIDLALYYRDGKTLEMFTGR